MEQPRPAVLCRNCPWRRRSPKAGEPGGSVPAHGADEMRVVDAELSDDGRKVMQCHNSSDDDPRPCAGFLSVVGFASRGVRLAVEFGIVRQADVGRRIRGLYGSLREMLREADHIDIAPAQQRARGEKR